MCIYQHNKKTHNFISAANKKHNNKFNYSLVTDIQTVEDKIVIICPTHGKFEQIARSHIRSKIGCPRCAGKGRKTTENFIDDAIKIHGEKYDYSCVNYVSAEIPIKINCVDHGPFFQTHSHLKGFGCKFCGSRYSIEHFIADSNIVHKNKFDYSMVNFDKLEEKIKIICPIHGQFEQKAIDHKNGIGCASCSRKKKKNNEEFIKDSINIHGDKFDYSLVNYINCKNKVRIICKLHGMFEQTPNEHLSGKQCAKCSGKNKKTTIEFICESIAFHGEKYDYSLVDYKSIKEKIIIICPVHGNFEQCAGSHIHSKTGCPKCSTTISKQSTHWLDSLNIKIREKSIKLHNGKKCIVDGYDPITNTVYEFNGDFWHGNPQKFNHCL